MGLEDVVLAVDWQFVKAPAVSNGSLPPRHGEVFHGDTVELEDARGVVVQLLTILKKSKKGMYPSSSEPLVRDVTLT